MTTRTKINIVGYTTSIMLLLNVFSKPLHIPEAFQWVLIIGVFIPIGLLFYFIKQQKMEKQNPSASSETAQNPSVDQRQSAKQRLVLIMILSCALGLCAPLWLPLTGTTLGVSGDLICGVVTAIIICLIFGIRLKKL